MCVSGCVWAPQVDFYGTHGGVVGIPISADPVNVPAENSFESCHPPLEITFSSILRLVVVNPLG